MERPQFGQLSPLPFISLKSRQEYQLVPADLLTPSEQHYEQIARICNFPEIQRWLFNNQAYPSSKAREFLQWGHKGWSEGTHFLFLVLTNDAEVAGAMDIKSADLSAAEVGYWASAEHPGITTPALAKMITLAKKAGYQTLYAQIKAGNERSKQVLIRNQFRENPDFLRNADCAEAFTLSLNSPHP